jgi:hypothetical protein
MHRAQAWRNQILEQTGVVERAVRIDRHERGTAGALKEHHQRLRLRIVCDVDIDAATAGIDAILDPVSRW